MAQSTALVRQFQPAPLPSQVDRARYFSWLAGMGVADVFAL